MPPIHNRRSHHHTGHAAQTFLRRWFLGNLLLSGALALLWVILRSGTKPSRLTYPCQQAAISTASLAFGVPFISALLAAWRNALRALRSPVGIATAGVGLFTTLGTWGYLSQAAADGGPRPSPRDDYRAQLYQVVNCPENPVGDRFAGLDNLLTMLGRDDIKFYRSPNITPVAGPDGIVAPDDVVVIKINYQWPERGGTNTDLLQGLIRRIVDHPDTFVGEVVVVENAQFNSTENFDRAKNNSQTPSLSPHDVCVNFKNLGHRVSHFDWTEVRYQQVQEYIDGDARDGYLIYDYHPLLQGRMSYPKYQTAEGTYISSKLGIWDPVSQTYDRTHLKFINLPVLKSHHATYGATAAVKHYMGLVTREQGTNSHNSITRGILGAVLGEIRPADLNILDCIWINANPNTGPQTTYADALRVDQLVASRDPVALDIWAVKNVLIPGFIKKGFSPPWPSPSADPDDPNSAFRRYLDKSMTYILSAGFDATNDFDQIDAFTWNPLGDLNCDGVTDFGDINPFVQALSDPAGYQLAFPECPHLNADVDRSGTVDFGDINPFVRLLTQPGQ